MGASPPLELEPSSSPEKMDGLMFGITTIDKIKLHSLIKFQMLLLPASKSVIMEVETRLLVESMLPLVIKMEQSLSLNYVSLSILSRKIKKMS